MNSHGSYVPNELDNQLEHFDRCWHQGTVPAIEDFLPPNDSADPDDAGRYRLLVELVLIDLEYRWRRYPAADGEPKTGHFSERPATHATLPDRPRLEDYVCRYPELGDLGRIPITLIAEEYRARWLWGDKPGTGEYLQRFKWQADRIRDQLPRIKRQVQGSQSPADVRIRCPHCFGPVDLADSDFSDVSCPSCGSHFSLLGESTEPPEHSQLGHFELLEKVGVGSFGMVWKARDNELDRIVAIKIPRRGLLDATESEQFLREARAVAQLCHPSIVAVHEVGRQADTVYIASDFVDGQTLEQMLRDGRPSIQESGKLCAEIADALQHAHQAGVIHRDLKPGNVIIDDGGRPHVTDFGLARREAGEVTMTRDGHVLGTPAYMSPELARGESHHADRRSDVYSLGVILFQLLTGELPFRGNVRMLIQQVVHEDAPSPRKLNSNIPRDLETICLECLEKEPAKRYGTAQDVAKELRRFLRDEPIHARPVTRVARTWRWCKRNPLPATLVVALVLAVVVGFTSVTSLWIRAVNETQLAILARDEKQQQAADLALQRGLDLCEQGKVDSGMLWLARSLELAPPESVDRTVRVNLALWRSNMLPLEQFLPHHGRVTSAIFSSDGKTVLTGTADGAARIWDVQKGKLVGKPMKHESWIRAVAFSPDDKLILTGSDDRKAQLWDAITCTPVGQPIPHEDYVLAVAFSPDGKTVLTGSQDGTARLWDTKTGKPIGQPLTHGDKIPSVAFSPNGEMVLTGSADKTARLWNAKTGEPVSKPLMHHGAVDAVAFSPDGSRFATGGDFGAFHIWNSATQERLPGIEGYYDGILTLSFSPNGSWIAVGLGDRAHLCDAETGRVIHETSVHNGDVTAAAFSGDGKKLLTASTDSTVGVWSAADIDPGRDVLEHDDGVWSVAFSTDGSRILTGGADGIRLWDVAARKTIQDLPLAGTVIPVDFAPDGLRAVVSEGSSNVSEGSTVRLREVPSLRPIGQPMEHDRSVSAVAFRSDGSQVLSASYDKTVKLWDGQSGKHITTLHHPAAVRSAAFDPDGSRILTGSVDKIARFWDVHTGQPIGEPLRHQGMVIAVAFSGDGALVATGSSDGLCRIWDSHTHQPVSRSLPHDGRVNAVAFSPNRKYIVTASDRIVRFWDVVTGKRIALPRRHDRSVSDVAFSPDGKCVLSGSRDGTARLWDAPPPPVKGDMTRIALWTQVNTGLELDQAGTVHVLDRLTWNERRQQLQALGGAPLP